MPVNYSHLPHIQSLDDLALYELIPDVVWIFDIDKHGWWWGNQAAIDYWGLTSLEQLTNKDLSGDTQGARDRTLQTFEKAAVDGMTIDPWTTYPNGKPKTVYMKHKAVLIGPEKHRAIIAFVNQEVNLGETPENLLLVEAMRYTKVLVTSFTFAGQPVIENPAATSAYNYISTDNHADSVFVARFVNRKQGLQCLTQAIEENGGRWTYDMRTAQGVKRHTLDIRKTRHPLTGDFLLLVAEYDVTELHQAKEQLQQLAHYDALTGLANLRQFEETGANMLAQAHRRNEQLAIMFIDLNGFKAVNDQHGHQAGDLLLKAVALRLREHLRDSDLIARIGGDEFVLMQANAHLKEDLIEVANKILKLIAEPFVLDSSDIQLGASIGIAVYPDNGQTMSQLLNAADQAMYQVKQQGKNGFQFSG